MKEYEEDDQLMEQAPESMQHCNKPIEHETIPMHDELGQGAATPVQDEISQLEDRPIYRPDTKPIYHQLMGTSQKMQQM